ncbi:hypothetical protein HDU97_004310 [Phlyctochytrium planicorne]|nr:hypothetical protein HDU97_004310 [Phlyctochytrium planicorne]
MILPIILSLSLFASSVIADPNILFQGLAYSIDDCDILYNEARSRLSSCPITCTILNDRKYNECVDYTDRGIPFHYTIVKTQPGTGRDHQSTVLKSRKGIDFDTEGSARDKSEYERLRGYPAVTDPNRWGGDSPDASERIVTGGGREDERWRDHRYRAFTDDERDHRGDRSPLPYGVE